MDAVRMNTTAIRPSTVPAAALLSSWNSYPWKDGICLDELAALDRVTVLTRNSLYEVVVVAPATGEVLVRGGSFFPEFTSARLAGCTLGGSFLKLRSIFTGFHMEFALPGGVIITSPVGAIATSSNTSPSCIM
jgi:hypothetical protein